VDYPDGIVVYQSRQAKLLEQFHADVIKFDPQPGSLIIIQPRDPDILWTDQFIHYLQDNLGSFVPEGVTVFINGGHPMVVKNIVDKLSDMTKNHDTQDDHGDYLNGWLDCINALESIIKEG
jgi:hypothetical protein